MALLDVLYGRSSDSSKEEIQWAGDAIAQYQYRKLFGLSYEEYLQEPCDVVMANRQITNIIEQIRQREIKRSQRRRSP